MKTRSLRKFIYISLAAAISTILLKFYAYYLTGSMGLYSDALESFVNLFAAIFALVMLNLSEKPADNDHEFGHSKAEYFSGVLEGALILVAAFSILYSAVPRIFAPRAIENISSGLLVSLAASMINLGAGILLIKKGKTHKSIILEADGKHLLTDVYTSAGVIIGILLVKATGFLLLDPVLAIIVALNIIWTGYKLIGRSANGLMDAAIPKEDITKITDYLASLKAQEIEFHSLLTRQAGQRKFISVHLLVPGSWTVKEGHDHADAIEKTIENMFDEPVNVSTHLEPVEDPLSFTDIGIDRQEHP
ncbi:MAG: cation diffusion facilitator family transporter [Dysgonamonadaceae bacterium]|jgi:cation diffusion facilitator family transporter|nr:cation diffusion facilitator family transporter [Dysgonamonadaceae bacterium]